jgi:hypothetical protein
MRFLKTPMLTFLITVLACAPLMAQGRSELALSFGGGSLQTGSGGGPTTTCSFSYQFHISSHFSAEGALDFFFYKFLAGPPDSLYQYKDDYAGAEAAVVYHLHANRRTGRWLPYLVAGIGKTTTDFTEIAAHPYYRLGAGVSYHLSDKWGLRLEARDEIIKRLYANGNPSANLPSLRLGIVYKF